MAEHSEEIEQRPIVPPVERRYEHIDVLCGYPPCLWHTKHRGGYQRDVALRLYREHVEAEHFGNSGGEG